MPGPPGEQGIDGESGKKGNDRTSNKWFVQSVYISKNIKTKMLFVHISHFIH